MEIIIKDLIEFTQALILAPQQCGWALQMCQAGGFGHGSRLRVVSVTTCIDCSVTQMQHLQKGGNCTGWEWKVTEMMSCDWLKGCLWENPALSLRLQFLLKPEGQLSSLEVLSHSYQEVFPFPSCSAPLDKRCSPHYVKYWGLRSEMSDSSGLRLIYSHGTDTQTMSKCAVCSPQVL